MAPTPLPVIVQKTRDKKESDLNSLKAVIEAQNQTGIRSKEDFEKKLELYKAWKIANNVTGIYY